VSALVLAAVALLAEPRPVVRSVALETDAVRPTLTIVASSPLPPPQVLRADDRLTLTWDADLSPGIQTPAPRPPLKALHLATQAGRVVLELTLDAAITYQVEEAGERVRIAFGAAPSAPRDVSVLWLTLFAASAAPEPEEAPPPQDSTPAASGAGDQEDGLQLGPVLLRPAVEALYVNALSTYQSPRPLKDDYFELRPRMGALATVSSGAFSADYEVRFRRGSRFAGVGEPSHFANASLDVPIGPRLTLHGSEHFARGTLETREVDPGGEYFFGLGRFSRNLLNAQARLQTAGRWRAEAGVSWETITVDDQSTFFGYDRQVVEARLGYELGPRLTATLDYAHDHIPPPPDRPIAEATADSLGLELKGVLGARTAVEATVGVRDQQTPQAGVGGRDFRGMVLTARVLQQLGPESSLQVSGARGTFPSSFQDDAFYVATGVGAELNVPAPFAIVLRLGAGYHWNDYRTRATGLAEPRQDRIWEGAIGLARPLSRRAWVRADYRRERRNSNLEGFDVTTHAFIAQVGFGFLGTPGR
jgi:hypothetical protein